MTNQDNRPMDPADLWQKAEALARERTNRSSESSAALSAEQIRKTLHELRVHQIESEMQNEELREAQAQIEAGRARYFDLYDLAPVGYCTLSEKGLILEANLTAATLLGTARDALIKLPIYRFILEDDQDIYYLHRKKLIETGEPQECELRLVKPDGVRFWAHLKGTVAQADDGAPLCRVVLSDITERVRAEQALRNAEALQRKMVANIGDVIVIIDQEGINRYKSPNIEKWFGWKPEEVIGALTQRQVVRTGHKDLFCTFDNGLVDELSVNLDHVDSLFPGFFEHINDVLRLLKFLLRQRCETEDRSAHAHLR